ncbi:hypothetical protein [Citrobacter braakii]|uniref:hypothetical protein n=1 Tax=Citrobacter freundii complex TaxID=1344959 RepID=UPI003C301840
MGKAFLEDCEFHENVVAISALSDSEIHAKGSKFVRNQKAIEFRDEIPDEVINLFQNDVNLQKVHELINEIREENNPKPEPIARRIEKVGLAQWIANGANITTIASAIIQAVTHTTT